MWGRGGIRRLFLNCSASCEWSPTRLGHFTPRERVRYSLNRGLCGHRAWYWDFGACVGTRPGTGTSGPVWAPGLVRGLLRREKSIFLLPGIESRFLIRSARSLVTVPTELSRLHSSPLRTSKYFTWGVKVVRFCRLANAREQHGSREILSAQRHHARALVAVAVSSRVLYVPRLRWRVCVCLWRHFRLHILTITLWNNSFVRVKTTCTIAWFVTFVSRAVWIFYDIVTPKITIAKQEGTKGVWNMRHFLCIRSWMYAKFWSQESHVLVGKWTVLFL